MSLFTFGLDNFEITDTRSAHKDTDYVAFTLGIGGAAPQSITKAMGDLNNGTFIVGLGFSEINVPLDASILLNYLIVNVGASSIHTANAIEDAVEDLGIQLTGDSDLNQPQFTSSLLSVANTFGQQLGAFCNMNSCDGLVAAEQNLFNYDQLLRITSQYPYFTQTTKHVGTPSRGGCNSKPSTYVVNWTVQQLVIVPPVQRGTTGATDATLGAARTALAAASLQTQVIKGPTSPTSIVVEQRPVSGGSAAINSFVELTTITGQ